MDAVQKPPPVTKKCIRCLQLKSVEAFSPSKAKGHGGIFPWCKGCKAAYQAERNARIPRAERSRLAKEGHLRIKANAELHKRYISKNLAYTLKKRYKLTADDVRFLLALQHYKCAICDVSLEKDPNQEGQKTLLHIDHDHSTKEVRGLLCQHCNSGLGFFKDNVDALGKAIQYLNDPPALRKRP